MARTDEWNQRDTQRRISKQIEKTPKKQNSDQSTSNRKSIDESTNTLAQQRTRTKKAPINEQYEKPNNIK